MDIPLDRLFDFPNVFDIPDREYLKSGDVCLILNAQTSRPIAISRIEFITPSDQVEERIVGFLLLGTGLMPLLKYSVPVLALKLKDSAVFTIKRIPYPISFSYVPIIKKPSER